MTKAHPVQLVLSLLFIISLLPISPAVQVQAAAPVLVRVDPASIDVPLGQTVAVAVSVVDVSALYGFDVALSFDPTVVEVVDADPRQAGIQITLGTFLDSGFVILNQVDNEAGAAHFAMTQLNPSPPKRGSGTLVTLQLRGKQISAGSPLTLTNAQLARRDGIGLETTTADGQIIVEASANRAPANTPFPPQPTGTPSPTPVPTTALVTATATPIDTRPLVTPAAIHLPPSQTPRPAATSDTPLPTLGPQASNAPASTTTGSASAPTAANIAAAMQPSATVQFAEPSAKVVESTTPAAIPAESSPAILLMLGGLLIVVGVVAVWRAQRPKV